MKNISVYDSKLHSFFAAANTGNGFTDRFREIFEKPDIKRIYILKGGPGAGKSTLMKKYAKLSAEKGYTPELYYCSSDTFSLDGVVIKETGCAIVDGTAPHVFDPTYPGTRDIIVNLGEAWDAKKLNEYKDRIKILTDKKKECYNTAYRFLAAAKNADDDMCVIGEKSINKAKLVGAATRFAERYAGKSGAGNAYTDIGVKREHIYNAISCKGPVRLFTPEAGAEKLFFVKDVKRTGGFFMQKLYESIVRKGSCAEIGINPLNVNEITSIFIPSGKICISMYDDKYCCELEKSGKPYKLINLGRFVDKEKYKDLKNKYRFSEKCRDMLMTGAYTSLAKAGAYHAELEEIYGSATDYAKVSELGRKFIGV